MVSKEAQEFEAGWYDAPAAPGEAEQDEFDRLIASAPTAADRLSAGDRESLLAYRDLAPEAARAHPTEEHFLPLYVAVGAAGRNATADRFYAAVEDGALAMDAYAFRP